MPFPCEATISDVSGIERQAMWLLPPAFTIDALTKGVIASDRTITMHGKRHSQGGQTLLTGAASVDIEALQAVHVDAEAGIARVECGASWDDLHRALISQPKHWAPRTHQSSPYFSIGGSLAVNCHGRDPSQPPLAGTVKQLEILLADGTIVACDADNEPDLFATVLGGYGACGILLRAWLTLKPEQTLVHHVSDGTPLRRYCDELVSRCAGEQPWPAMHYAFLKFEPNDLFSEAIVVDSHATKDKLAGELRHESVISDDGMALLYKAFRENKSPSARHVSWSLFKQLARGALSVTERQLNAMRAPVRFSLDQDADHVDLLQEYFLPPRELNKFLTDYAAPILQDAKVNLLSSTVRIAQQDAVSVLNYAPNGPRVSVVLNFSIARAQTRPDASGTSSLDRWSRKLIDGSLACGGSFYLPYARHATLAQFQSAYPRWDEFRRIRRQFDKALRFDNAFLQAYGL